MSKATAQEPTTSVSTVYQAADLLQPSPTYSQAQQPDCSQGGVDQTATPEPSPSR